MRKPLMNTDKTNYKLNFMKSTTKNSLLSVLNPWLILKKEEK